MLHRPFRVAACAVLVALVSCRSGCGRVTDRAATVEGRLALFPAATQLVAAVEATRLRAGPAAAKLAELAHQSDADRRTIETFARRTGFDPLRDIDSVTVAFPEDARVRGELGVVVRAQHLDETRLVAYARDELQKTGDDLVSTRHGRFTLWAARSSPDLAGFFIDARTFAMGGGGWAARMAELAETARPGDSAATNVDLVRLVDRASVAHAVWGVAIVPADTRKQLAADPATATAASVKTLSAGIDLGGGLEALVVADMAGADDARALATKVTESLRDAKRNAQILMLGLGPYLDGVNARAAGETFELRARLDEHAVDDLLARLRAFLDLRRSGAAPGFPR